METFEITSQDKYFPLYYKDNETYEEHKKRLLKQRYTIKDDLLYRIFDYGDVVSTEKYKNIHSYVVSKGRMQYILLQFFIRRAFNIFRLPFFDDRILTNYSPLYKDDFLKIYKELLEDENRLQNIIDEIKAIHSHTQNQLKLSGLDEYIILHRRIHSKYASRVTFLKKACETLCYKTLKLPMDILNSYGDDKGYEHFPITIYHQIPINNVFTCNNLLEARSSYNKGALEPGEWLIINRNPMGFVEIPLGNIQINSDGFYIDELYKRELEKFNSKYYAQKYIEKQLTEEFRILNYYIFPDFNSENHEYISGIYKPKLKTKIIAAWNAWKNCGK